MGRQKAAVVQGHALAHGLPRVRITQESDSLLDTPASSLGLQDDCTCSSDFSLSCLCRGLRQRHGEARRFLHGAPDRLTELSYTERPCLCREDEAKPWDADLGPGDNCWGYDTKEPPVRVSPEKGPKAHVLVCAPSNSALDEIVLRLDKHGLLDRCVPRLALRRCSPAKLGAAACAAGSVPAHLWHLTSLC